MSAASTKKTVDAVLIWDQEGPGRLADDGHVHPVELSSLRGRRVVAVLARRLTLVRATELPPASPEDLRRLVALRIGDLFPAAQDIAYSIAPRAGEGTGAPGPAAVFAARNADLAAIQAAAKANGFHVVATLPAAAGSVELAEELGLPDALVLERDGEGIGLDVIAGLELVLSRRTSGEANLEGEVRRTFVAAKTGAIPIVATNGFHAPFADRHSPKTATATLVEREDRWPTLDLVPEPVRAERARAERYRKIRAGALVLVSSLLLAAYVVKIRSDQAADVQKAERRDRGKIKQLQTRLDLLNADNSKRAPQSLLLNRAFRPAQRTSDVGVLVTSLLPPGAWLTSVTIERAKTVRIVGTATSSDAVAAYLRNLGSQKRLRNVILQFANTAEIEQKPVVNFSITAFPVGNVPLEEATKRKR